MDGAMLVGKAVQKHLQETSRLERIRLGALVGRVDESAPRRHQTKRNSSAGPDRRSGNAGAGHMPGRKAARHNHPEGGSSAHIDGGMGAELEGRADRARPTSSRVGSDVIPPKTLHAAGTGKTARSDTRRAIQAQHFSHSLFMCGIIAGIHVDFSTMLLSLARFPPHSVPRGMTRRACRRHAHA
eukprot:5744155-Pleurochrysis_carterae.AAC.2